MVTSNFYKYTTWVLLLLNIGVLAYFLSKKSHRMPPPHGQNMKKEVINNFNFEDEQIIAFEKLATDHKDRMQAIREKQKELIFPFFNSLKEEQSDVNLDSLISDFQYHEKEKLMVTYDHFKDIKQLLNQEQLRQFNPFMQKIIKSQIMGERRKKNSKEQRR